MSITLIFQAIMAVLNFPAAMSAFIKLLSKTPDEKKADIVTALQAQLQSFEDTGRPS